MRLTPEQQAIIEAARDLPKAGVLKIQAAAGSGKTFILLQIAQSLPHASFLYLAFNRSIVEEMHNKATKNMTVKTTHALAYSHILTQDYPDMQPRKEYTAFEIGEILENRNYHYIARVRQILYDFCNSSLERFSARLGEGYQDAQKIYMMMKRGEIPFTHAFYLKEYQLLPAQQRRLDYDYVLLDEAQDTNEVTLDIFLQMPCRKILVGDEHQSIYGFRGAFNALSNINTAHKHMLTQCFRTPQCYLDKATFFLNHFKDLPQNVWIVSQIPQSFDCATSAILTRTNAKIVEIIAKNASDTLHIVKNPDEIFAMILSLKALQEGNRAHITAPHLQYLKKFKNLDEVQQYAEDTNEPELKYSIFVLNQYGKDIVHLYRKAKKLYQNKEGTALLTTHTAKGLEFDRVTIEDDFSNLYEQHQKLFGQGRISEVAFQKFYEEINLYYVAITRTKKQLIDKSQNDFFYKMSF